MGRNNMGRDTMKTDGMGRDGTNDPAPDGLPRLPRIQTPPPGPATKAWSDRLRAVESRNVTFLGADFPVVWRQAEGASVEDADGNVYLDLTGAFGVAVAGHAHPRITAAIRRQAGLLPHGMGDVHPPVGKVEFLERLAHVLPWRSESRIVLASAGSEAVEIALKTALLATGRSRLVAFRGGYHGLTLGSLAVTARRDFREPFRSRLYSGVEFIPFPVESAATAGSAQGLGGAKGAGPPGGTGAGEGGESGQPHPSAEMALAALDRALEGVGEGTSTAGHDDGVGAVIVEPIQGRAGVRVPPAGFLAEVARRTRQAGALLILDEIFTGLGRTGTLFALEREGIVPDLVCLGKAMGGGLPLSACAGPREIMDAWPPSWGEALHTSTFLGHPLACASGTAFLQVLQEEGLVEKAVRSGARLRTALEEEVAGRAGVVELRGRGLFLGIELDEPGAGAGVAAAALRRGLLVLPAGEDGQVVELSPPLTLSEEQIKAGAAILGTAVGEWGNARSRSG